MSCSKFIPQVLSIYDQYINIGAPLSTAEEAQAVLDSLDVSMLQYGSRVLKTSCAEISMRKRCCGK